MSDTALDTDPTLGDGTDPPDDEGIIEFEPDNKDYPWTTDPDEMLRSFIFQTVVDSGDQIVPQVELMHACYQWIKSGEPPPEKQGKKAHLKPVKVTE